MRLGWWAAALLLFAGCLRLVDFQAKCSDESDCASGQRCFESRCQGPCVQDDDCGDPTLRCRDSRCETFCTADAACGAGKICDDSRCVEGCRHTSECQPSQGCVDLKCQTAQRCQQNSDCTYPQLCFEEACVFRKCNSSAPCPSDLQCLGGNCVIPGSGGIPATGCGSPGLHCCPFNDCGTGCCVRVEAKIFACVAAGTTCGEPYASFCQRDTRSCDGCGGLDEPCCNVGGDQWCTASNVSCDRSAGRCRACGHEGQRCCSIASSSSPGEANSCDHGLACTLAAGAELCTKAP
jgi:hypothetical protein